MSPRITDCFNAALKQLLKSEGRGGQTDLAMRLGVTKPYLNNLLSGRKARWPDHLKEAAASVFGYSVAELLILGEAFLQTGIWFPYARKLMHLSPKSIERAVAIFRAAAEDVGLGMTQILFSPQRSRPFRPSASRNISMGPWMTRTSTITPVISVKEFVPTENKYLGN